MWKAIRLHPWRLEIVPAAAFALTVWSAYVYQTRVAAFVRTIPEMRNGPITILPKFCIAVVIFFWFIEFSHNQSWVQSEQRKRYNAFALLMQGTIICHAWLGFAFTCITLWLKRYVAPLPNQLPLLALMMVLGLGTTALLEWNRKYIPREETPEPPLVSSATSENYREMSIDWWTLIGALFMLVFAIAPIALSLCSRSEAIACLLIGIPGAALIVSLSIHTIVITPTTLGFFLGPFRIRLTLKEMESCVVGRRDDEKKPRGIKRTTWCKRGERCIDVTMKNGRLYRLGALRPSHICELIQQAAKDLPPAPSASEGEISH